MRADFLRGLIGLLSSAWRRVRKAPSPRGGGHPDPSRHYLVVRPDGAAGNLGPEGLARSWAMPGEPGEEPLYERFVGAGLWVGNEDVRRVVGPPRDERVAGLMRATDLPLDYFGKPWD